MSLALTLLPQLVRLPVSSTRLIISAIVGFAVIICYRI
jgi:phosphate/sulfate permease